MCNAFLSCPLPFTILKTNFPGMKAHTMYACRHKAYALSCREHPVRLCAHVHSYSQHTMQLSHTLSVTYTMEQRTHAHKQVHLQAAVTEARCPGGPFGNERARKSTCMQAGAWWASLSCSLGLSRSHRPSVVCTHTQRQHSIAPNYKHAFRHGHRMKCKHTLFCTHPLSQHFHFPYLMNTLNIFTT